LSNISLHKDGNENGVNVIEAGEFVSENEPERFSTTKWELGNSVTSVDASTRNAAGDEDSLLKYDIPIRFVESDSRRANFKDSTLFQVLKSEAEFSYMKAHSKFRCSRKQIPTEDTRAVLNLIKTPSRFVLKGEVWNQEISLATNNCDDANTLESKLDTLLITRKARVQGCCPVRRALYDDCLDEIHRQIALESPERAILLLRCRQEIQSTMTAFANLFGSIQTYNLRQSVLKNNGYQDFHDKLKSAKDEKMQLTRSYEALEEEIRQSRATYELDEATFQKKKNDELEYLRAVHLRLLSQTSKFLNSSKTVKSPAEVGPAGDTLNKNVSKGASVNSSLKK